MEYIPWHCWLAISRITKEIKNSAVKNKACRPAIWRSHMKRIRSVMPAKKKTSVFMEKMFDLTRGSVWKSKGRMAGLVKSKKIVIMLTKKNLNKNLLNNLARDNLLQNIKPGKTYSIKIKKKRRRRRKKNPVQYYFGENSHLGNRRKYNFFRFKIRPSIFSVL